MALHKPTSSESQGAFARGQATWAAHGIATFPVEEKEGRKKPLVERYWRFGLRGSADLVRKFSDATALGFIAGRRSGVTVLDIDTQDTRILADALARHGASPLIVRTASGKYHIYYHFNGEWRRIRPWGPELPIDIIGAARPPGKASVVVAPQSKLTKGTYEIIEGHYDDLDRLPMAKGLVIDKKRQPQRQSERDVDTEPLHSGTGIVHEGRRNTTLWEYCMRTAKAKDCKSFDSLADAARTFNKNCCVPPLEDAEVFATAKSAWDITERGANRYGTPGAFCPTVLYNEMVDAGATDQDALMLLCFLRANHLPCDRFMCTNTLADRFGWRRQRFTAARGRLIERGLLVQVKCARTKSPAMFEFPKVPEKYR